MSETEAKESPGKEVEIVLVVVSPHPDEVAKRIAAMESIAGYHLNHRPMEVLQDVYFDTADSLLKKKRFNLRLRRIDNSYRITMKKNPGLFSLARNVRQELELPWSESSLRRVWKEFEDKGVRLDVPRVPDSAHPEDALLGAGLRVIQSRETRREARDISLGAGQPVLAELAVDFVEYNFNGNKVGFYELEIEAKSAEGKGILEKVATSLQQSLGELRRWRYGKLMTGNAIKELMDANELEGLVKSGVLAPEGFERVRVALS